MNTMSRTITGLVMILVGLVLTIIGVFGLWFLLIYGLPILIIGIFILLNTKEDKIEAIKSEGGKK